MTFLRFMITLYVLASSEVLADTPGRIVSMNLCTDQMVLQLAEPGTVVSVSFLTADPAESPMADQTEGLVLNHGQAEEVIALKPDLVVTGRYTTSAAKLLLKRLGYAVAEVEMPLTFDAVRKTYLSLGETMGRMDTARLLVDDLDRRYRDILTRVGNRTFGTVLILDANGFTVGRPSLVDAVLTRIGLANVAAQLNIGDFGQITMEAILLAKPDQVVRMDYRSEAPSLANQTLSHPALSQYLGSRSMIAVPQSWLNCGGPYLADAAERVLAAITPENRGGAF